MDISSTSSTDFNVNMTLSEEELNQLLDEIEIVFLQAVKKGTLSQIPRLIEFKNLLTLSVNNN